GVRAWGGHARVAGETGGGTGAPRSRAPPPPMLVLEAASWLNQSPNVKQPVRVTATARSFEQANALSGGVAKALAPLLLGDPARVQAVTDVQPDAPAEGAVTIAPGH